MGWSVAPEVIREALGTGPGSGPDFVEVTTDTRSLLPGSLFVALRGENFDGHDFIAKAVASGASGVVAQGDLAIDDETRVYSVSDTRDALGRIARARRNRFEGPVIAITGTNGKTSTKEFIAGALGSSFDVHRTPANDNNLIGVPLTVLKAPESATAWVIEVGASQPGEIARLRDVVSPDIAVVTNVGNAHLEGFGSVEAVLNEKVSLLRGARTAVVGEHPPELTIAARSETESVVVAGVGSNADVRADMVRLTSDGVTAFEYKGIGFEIPVPGRHLVGNAMIAIAIAELLGLPLDAVANRLAKVEIPGARTRLRQVGKVTVLDDCYNANPESTVAAIETVEMLAGDNRRVLVLGSMLELGQQTTLLHREVAHRALESEPAIVVAVGEFASAFEGVSAPATDVYSVRNSSEAGELLKEIVEPGDFVLLKGSRGVKLEVALSMLKESQE